MTKLDNLTRLDNPTRLELAAPISALFNMCLRYSFVPSQWKLANIVPIPKIPHPEVCSDYRPIALTSVLCKIFERILAQQILGFTSHKDIWLTNNQFGFLPGRSTMDAIIKVIEEWSRAKDQKLPTTEAGV